MAYIWSVTLPYILPGLVVNFSKKIFLQYLGVFKLLNQECQSPVICIIILNTLRMGRRRGPGNCFLLCCCKPCGATQHSADTAGTGWFKVFKLQDLIFAYLVISRGIKGNKSVGVLPSFEWCHHICQKMWQSNWKYKKK